MFCIVIDIVIIIIINGIISFVQLALPFYYCTWKVNGLLIIARKASETL